MIDIVVLKITLLLFIISILPIFIILIGIFLILFKKNKYIRKRLVIDVISCSLISNTIILIIYGFSNTILRLFYFNFEKGTVILLELILFIGLITSIFSKDEIDLVINENVHDGLILIIIFGLCCYILSLNILIISTWLIFILMFMTILFYYSDYYKSLKILRLYIIGLIICVSLLFISNLIIFLQFKSLILTEIPLSNNLIIYILLIIGFSIPYGFFPFTIYNLRNFYKESSYTNFLLYLALSIINSFQIIRFLRIFAFSSQVNAFILISVASIGFIISLIFIFKELFGTFDGATYSIKKIFGYLICMSFNFLILMSSFTPILITLNIEEDYYNLQYFSILFISLIELEIFYNFYPIMVETNDDNLHLLGDFWLKYRAFGIFYFMIGFILTIPFSFTFFNSLWIISITTAMMKNSLYFTLFLILNVFFFSYIITYLIFISISFITIYFGSKPRYIKKNEIKKVKNYYSIPNIIIIGLIVFLFFLFNLKYNVYYNWFLAFFL